MLYQNHYINVIIPTKNMGTALLLTFIFGPLGMFYTTTIGAIIMLILSTTIGIFTFGIGLIISWPIQLIWTAISINLYNKRVVERIIYYKRASLKRRAFTL